MSTPTSTGPLAGLRVVEMEAIGPLLHAGMLLADLGADVVRVARPAPAAAEDGVADANAAMLRGRTQVALDLKDPDDRARLLDLLDHADVLLEGFRPGTMERLGLGPDECLERRPALVYARMSGWGQDGPRAQEAGHDINYLAVAGALDPMGPAGTPPVPPLNYVANFGGGSMFLLLGVLAALHERSTTGRGQVVDAAMVDGAASLTSLVRAWQGAGRWSPERGTNLLDGAAPFYRAYACADGRHLAVGALEDVFYDRFVAGLGLDTATLPDRWDRRAWPAMTETFAARVATRTRDAWMAAYDGTDACVTPVLTLEEAAADPHAVARGAYADGGAPPLPGPAPHFSGHPSRPAAPARPATTDDVLAAWRTDPGAQGAP